MAVNLQHQAECIAHTPGETHTRIRATPAKLFEMLDDEAEHSFNQVTRRLDIIKSKNRLEMTKKK